MNKKELCMLLRRGILLAILGVFLVGQFSTVYAATPKVKEIKWSNVDSKIYMAVKSTKKLKVKITPAKAKKRKLKWSSSNKQIATVSKTGKVYAKKTGSVTITCKVSSQSKKKVKCKIQVVKPTKTITMSTSLIVIQQGNTYKRTAKVSPQSATVKGLKYTSSNSRIALVDKNGKVTGKSEGIATITVSAKDGFAKKVSYKVQVIGKLKGSAKYIAHRGLSSQAPENTIKAYQLAGEEGLWGAETDIRKTMDGQFILMHDSTLKRMCGIDKAPEEMTLSELKSIPIITGGNYSKYKNDKSATTIPTLEEYLQTCRKYNMVPVIEIKMALDFSEEESKEMQTLMKDIPVETVDAHNMRLQSVGEDDLIHLYEVTQSIMEDSKVVFIASNLQALVKMRAIIDKDSNRTIELQHVVNQVDNNNIELYKEYGINLDANYQYLDVKTAKNFMDSGILVNVWTIDDQVKVWEYVKNKIPYITTNCSFW